MRAQLAISFGRKALRNTQTLFVSAGILILLDCFSIAKAGTLFTVPILVVTPGTLELVAVATNSIATNTFLVENAGGGKLVGRATVAPPFKIVDGADYVLRENEVQVVTITYTATSARTNTQTVRFTGASGATATVIGKLSAPAAPQGFLGSVR